MPITAGIVQRYPSNVVGISGAAVLSWNEIADPFELRTRTTAAKRSGICKLLPGHALGPGTEAENAVGAVCLDVLLRPQHDVLQRAVGDVQPAVRTERERVGPADAR